MVAQRVAGVGMHENVERTVIEREPFHDLREMRPLEGELIRPQRMRTDGPLVKTAHLQDVAKTGRDFFPQLPRFVARRGIEIDVGMPARDGCCINRVIVDPVG